MFLVHRLASFAVACRPLLNEALRAVFYPPCVYTHPEELVLQQM